MRGTPTGNSTNCTYVGIIPAYAGNTTSYDCCTIFNRDHPRVCGEHRSVDKVLDSTQGSSPRMRGTLLLSARGLTSRGIIPAYAGNTLTQCVTPRHRRDHPRVCGEHYFVRLLHDFQQGSSPRMRGTHGNICASWYDQGIIPAYAGNTATGEYPLAGTRDHPRVCGEHPNAIIVIAPMLGSSPRMRGTRMRIRTGAY